jgi:hypothetical protein
MDGYQDASSHEIVEQLAARRQLLLDARLCNFGAQLLDARGLGDRLDIIEPEVVDQNRAKTLPREAVRSTG